MAPIYSQLLWSGVAYSAGEHLSPPVPLGYVWVLRDVSVFIGVGPTQSLGGWTLTDIEGAPIANRYPPFVLAAQDQEWHGHQVVNTGDHLVMVTYDLATSWRVSGYALTTP